MKIPGAGRHRAGLGLTAEIYRSAGQATWAISRRMPDAVVVDLKMPGLCGLVWARTLKSAWPKLPVLLVQGYSNKEIAAALKISPGTVHSHVARLFKARSVHNRKQASREFVASMIPARLGCCLKCLDGESLRDLNNSADR